MFCWGSTIHGELGLGGIEDENIFMPREVDFAETSNIEQSKLREYLRVYKILITKELYQKLKFISCVRRKLYSSYYKRWKSIFLW